jgi:hypothetical protein
MNNIRNDKNLQEAVSRHEQQLEPMPADLNERLMNNLSLTPAGAKRQQAHPRLHAWRRWSAGLAAAIAASFLLMWLFNFSQTPSNEAPLLAQQTKTESEATPSTPAAEEPQTEMTVGAKPEQHLADNQIEAEPQTIESVTSDDTKSPRPNSRPQAIPDIASPQGERFLASTSNTVTFRSHHDGFATTATPEESEDDGLNLAVAKEKGWMPEGWTDLKSWSNGQKLTHALTDKERKALAVTVAVKDKRWHIDITSMNTMRYGSRTVSTDFFLELRGDTLRSYLPYLGQAQVSTSLSPTIGLNFERPVRQYKESRPKNKYTQIDIDVKTNEDTYHYTIDIYDSGDAYIRVRSLNRDPISFDGTLETKY